jgi:hypothetical protein
MLRELPNIKLNPHLFVGGWKAWKQDVKEHWAKRARRDKQARAVVVSMVSFREGDG